MIGFVADNIMNGMTEQVLWRELDELDKEEYKVLDIREDVEMELGTIEGSIHIPLNELRDRLGELDKDKTYVAFCAIGLRGYLAERALKDNGFKAMNLAGGFNTYKNMYMQSETNIDQEPKTFNESGMVETNVGKQ
jgi:rhodanese-related sulfurtransferase